MLYISEYKKAFYDCINCDFSTSKLKEIIEKENITIEGYKQRAKKYYSCYSTKEEKSLYDKHKKNSTSKLSPEKLKEAFDNCIICNFDNDILLPYAKEEIISVNSYIARATKYYFDLANEEEKKQYDTHRIIKTVIKNSQFYREIKKQSIIEMIDSILSLESIEEQVKCVINKYSYRTETKFIKDIGDYYDIYDTEKLKDLSKAISMHFEAERKKVSEIKKQERKLHKNEVIESLATEIIILIDNETFNLENYLKEKNMMLKTFENKMTEIYEINKDFYIKIKNYIEKQQLKNNKKLLEETKQISLALKNGIIIDGEQKPLSILDYYFITKSEMYLIQKNLEKYNFDEKIINLLNTFRIKNSNTNNFMLESELNGNRYYMKNGKQIEVTKEEKLEVIEFLKKHNIPINNLTYNIALRRKVNNILTDQVLISDQELQEEKIFPKKFNYKILN